MNITEIKSEGLKQDFRVVIPVAHFEKRFNERLLDIGKTARLPGFRPGKASLQILNQHYGQSIKGEVLEQVVQDGIQNLIHEKKLRPALQPKVELEKYTDGEDIAITVSMENLPEVKPVKIEELTFERTIADVPQEKFETTCEELRNSRRTPGDPVDRAAANNDVVMIDFTGRIKADNTLIEGGSGENVPLELGSNTFIPGFEDQLIGASAGEKVTVNVTFPENYQEPKLAGKEAVFDVTVREVRSFQTPELNDELAKGFGFENLTGLEDFIRRQLESESRRMSDLISKRRILDYFADNIKFEVPAGLVDLEFDTIWKQYRDIQNQENAQSEDEEKERQQYRDIAERRVRLGLLLAEIGRHYEIKVTQQELEAAIYQTARRYPGQERQVFEYFQKNKAAVANLRAPIFEDKVIGMIIDKSVNNEKKVSWTELEALVRELTEGDDDDVLSVHHDHGDDGHVHGPDCNHDHA